MKNASPRHSSKVAVVTCTKEVALMWMYTVHSTGVAGLGEARPV